MTLARVKKIAAQYGAEVLDEGTDCDTCEGR